mgnify:CR=1 FL=1
MIGLRAEDLSDFQKNSIGLKKTDKKTVEDDICDRMKDVQSTHKNTWKYAVYKAIFYSEWFWKEYLLML